MSTTNLANPNMLFQQPMLNNNFNQAAPAPAVKKPKKGSHAAQQQQAMVNLLAQPNGMATFLIGFQSQMD